MKARPVWTVLIAVIVSLFHGQISAQETRFSCGFEETGERRFCGFIQDITDSQKDPTIQNPDLTQPGASFDWQARCDPTPTQETGPQTAAEGSCYAYIETSNPQNAGDEARMTTPALNYIGQMCVDFQYHMYGENMGTLIVYLQNGEEYTFTTQQRVQFQQSGNQGDVWNQARVTVQTTSQQDRVGFLGRKGNDYRSDIALDSISVTTGNCEGTPSPVSLPFQCSFETEAICNFMQSSADTFDWTRRSGGTDTTLTGPTAAFHEQYYMYIETSDPRAEGDYAILETPPINFNGQICVDVAFHMYGEDMGSLEVITTSRGQNNPWHRVSGDQGLEWNTAMIDIDLRQNDRVGFLARRGRNIRSDIAIDLVEIFAGHCEDVTEGPEPTLPPTGESDLPFQCNFETDLCGMYQLPEGEGSSNDEFDWTRHSGPTDSEGTGPTGAYRDLYYIYTEASLPQIEGNEAVIETPSLRYNGDVCVRFWYHMYDATTQNNMGRLRVYRSISGNTIFDISGNQGNQWIQASQDTVISFGERIVFVGVRGRDIQGDISLDDISITQGRCSQTPVPTPSPPDGTVGEILNVYMCDAEGDGSSQSSCRLRQDTQEVSGMQWIMNTGRTPSGRLGDRRINGVQYPVTGPSAAFQGNRYLFLEASGRAEGDMARLFIEGNNMVSSGDACLRFAYNMNGFHMGELLVYVMENGVKKEKWEMEGDQYQDWHLAAVDLRMNSVSQVGFEGYAKGEFSGDVAIDAIQFSSGRCTNPQSGYIWQCDFEASNGASAFCNMEQSTTDSQNYDWQLWTGRTPSEETGPSFAYNGQYFLYLEASSPYREGEFANVLLPRLERTGSLCMEFRYYMYGHHVGRLETFLRQNGFDGQQIFTISGEQGQSWRQARVGIANIGFNDQIGFRGVRGGEYSGDIAIDNVRVRTGICDSTESA